MSAGLDPDGDPLECPKGHPTEFTGKGYRWCGRCCAAVWTPGPEGPTSGWEDAYTKIFDGPGPTLTA